LRIGCGFKDPFQPSIILYRLLRNFFIGLKTGWLNGQMLFSAASPRRRFGGFLDAKNAYNLAFSGLDGGVGRQHKWEIFSQNDRRDF
jgi:hypothetical protein